MSVLTIGAITLGVACAVALVAWIAARLRRRRKYDAVVGLDLAGLIELLPEHLRHRRYTTFVLAPADGANISVGIVYDDQQLRRGNPPNVGMDFDAKTGELVQIHENGIGLGIK